MNTDDHYLDKIVHQIKKQSYSLYDIDINHMLTIGDIKKRLTEHEISYDDLIKSELILSMDKESYQNSFDPIFNFNIRSQFYDDETIGTSNTLIHIQKIWETYTPFFSGLKSHSEEKIEIPNISLHAAPIGDMSSSILIAPGNKKASIIFDTWMFEMSNSICLYFSKFLTDRNNKNFKQWKRI